MSLWRYFMAVIIIGCLSANAAAENGEPANPVFPPYTVPGPDKARLTFYRTQGDLNVMYPIGRHGFCALAGMTQSNTGATCACEVDFHKADDKFHKKDGWVLLMTAGSLLLGRDMNVFEQQQCGCRAVCWDRAKAAE